MIRICTKPNCYRYWVSLASEENVIHDLCPTCRIGMEPLSMLRGEPKSKGKPPESKKEKIEP